MRCAAPRYRVGTTVSHAAAMIKVAGAISKSGEIMKSMNALMRVGAMQAGMQVSALR